jgi:hypothetical protein
MKTPVEEFASVLQQLTEKVRELELRRCRPGRARPMVAVRVVSHSSRGEASSSVRRAAGIPRAASGDRPLVAETGSFVNRESGHSPAWLHGSRRSLEARCRFGSPGVLKSDRGRKEAIRDRVDPVCTLRGRRSDCRVLVNWCTLERCDP